MTNKAAERLREAVAVITATGMIFPDDRVAIEAGLAAALAAERAAGAAEARERIRAAVPEDWAHQLDLIEIGARQMANPEQITLVDLCRKARRVLLAILDAGEDR